MKPTRHLIALLVLITASAYAFGQGKGVDKQDQRISDNGANKGAANNGTKTDVGTSGSGINFGKDKTPARQMLANPYRFTSRRDVIIKAVQDVMRDRKLILDEASSRPDDGILVAQPYTFIKGAVVTGPELNRYASILTNETRGWTRGRYTISVEVQPIDGVSANVSVNAKVEGRTDGPTGAEWITLPSSGVAEEEFLEKLVENLTGASPSGALRRPSDLNWKYSILLADNGIKTWNLNGTTKSVIINANPKSTTGR